MQYKVITRDLTEPSPLALEVLSARPWAFLDDAPLEERRAQAVMTRRWLSPELPTVSAGSIQKPLHGFAKRLGPMPRMPTNCMML